MRRVRRFLLGLLAMGVVGFGAGAGTIAAFSSSTSNPGNSFSAGTVAIGDNDEGESVATLSSAKPGDFTEGCISVRYSGSLDAGVRLYATVTGGLAPYLTLTITRGTGGTSFPSCGGFLADSTNYIGQGNGVIYTGLLSAYPTDYSSGLTDPSAATPDTWTTDEAHTYRFVVTLNDDNAAQGLSSTAVFRWEARNL